MKVPEPQDYLAKGAIEIYEKIAAHIEGVDGLQNVDSFAISMTADCLYQFKLACEKVNEIGNVQEFKNGTNNINAWFTVKKECLDKFLKYSAKLGMTIKDRNQIEKFKATVRETDALDLL